MQVAFIDVSNNELTSSNAGGDEARCWLKRRPVRHSGRGLTCITAGSCRGAVHLTMFFQWGARLVLSKPFDTATMRLGLGSAIHLSSLQGGARTKRSALSRPKRGVTSRGFSSALAAAVN
jgi:hypothetical protein